MIRISEEEREAALQLAHCKPSQLEDDLIRTKEMLRSHDKSPVLARKQEESALSNENASKQSILNCDGDNDHAKDKSSNSNVQWKDEFGLDRLESKLKLPSAIQSSIKQDCPSDLLSVDSTKGSCSKVKSLPDTTKGGSGQKVKSLTDNTKGLGQMGKSSSGIETESTPQGQGECSKLVNGHDCETTNFLRVKGRPDKKAAPQRIKVTVTVDGSKSVIGSVKQGTG